MWINERGDGVATCLDCGRKGHVDCGAGGSGELLCEVHGTDGFDAKRPRAPAPSVFVSELTIPASVEWEGAEEPERGILRVCRFPGVKDNSDAWCIEDCGNSVLSRHVFGWKKDHPSEPLVLPVDFDDDAPEDRKRIADLFHYYPRGRRTDEEDALYAFTLEEALHVCGVKL